MRDDAIHFKKLLIGVCLGDVKIPHHSSPVALTAAAAEVRECQTWLENVYMSKTSYIAHTRQNNERQSQPRNCPPGPRHTSVHHLTAG